MSERPIPFEIAANSGVPIYRQLVDQVHALVAGDQFPPGSRLPSVRDVARAAAVNPMTVSKAYSLLEAEGVVRRVRGQGMEVLPPSNDKHSLAERIEQYEELARPALYRGRQLGLTREQMLASIHTLLEEISP